VRRIGRASDGLTRRINILADKALLAAYTENTHAITDRHVRAAVADSEFAASRRSWRPLAYLGAAAVAGIAVGAGLQWMRSPPPIEPPLAQAPLAVVAPPPAAAPAPEPVKEDLPEPESLLSAEQERRLSGYSPAGQRLLAARLSASLERLERADDERYALELYVSDNSDPARMERFLLRARDLVPLDELMVIPVASGGHYRLWVLFGDFASHAEAVAAAHRLPPRYQDAFRVAPRSFGELRREWYKSGKSLRDRRLRRVPQVIVVLSLPREGVPRHEHDKDGASRVRSGSSRRLRPATAQARRFAYS
jgi:MSHA biogenesis protein MshM